MVQKTRLNNAPGGFGVPKGKPRRGPVRPPQGHPQVTPRGQNLTKKLVSRWSPVCQNIAMPGPETELYGVKQHCRVVRWLCLAPSRLGFALTSFSSRSRGRQTVHLNSAPGGVGVLRVSRREHYGGAMEHYVVFCGGFFSASLQRS